jgi:hypothetical protein
VFRRREAPTYETLPKPLAALRSLAEYRRFVASERWQAAMRADQAILDAHAFEETWSFEAYSGVCGQRVAFLVDADHGQRLANGRWVPNLRERLVCPVTRLNNRQRLVAEVVREVSKQRVASHAVYLMEDATPIFQWTKNNLPGWKIIGSEYLGENIVSGSVINGIRHEDVHNLSLRNSQCGLIVSNDVMEHVAWPAKAFVECHRVLCPGGRLIMTIPLTMDVERSAPRARYRLGSLVHFEEPVFHSNPLTAEGSLVFTDYGWDVLDLLLTSGFSDAWVDLHHAEAWGHLGPGLLVVHALH